MDWTRVADPGEEGWGEVFRRAPIGVLVLSGLLLLAGAGFIFGGVFFALSGTGANWLVWMFLLGVGPLFVYLALHFVLLHHWAWLAVVALIILLALSALVRTVTAEAAPVAPLFELVVGLATLAYLNRTHVRKRFARG